MIDPAISLLSGMVQRQGDRIDQLSQGVARLDERSEVTNEELQGVRRRLHELSDSLQALPDLSDKVGQIGRTTLVLQEAAIRMEAATQERERMIRLMKWVVGALVSAAGVVTAALIWAAGNIERVAVFLRGGR